MKHALLLAPVALLVACAAPKEAGDGAPLPPAPTPAEPAAVESAPEPPAPAVDGAVGTWVFDAETSWEANVDAVMSIIEPMLEGAPAEALAAAREEAKAGFEQQSVEIVLGADGSVDSRFRETAEDEWFTATGTWVRDEAGVLTMTTHVTDENGEPDPEAAAEVQTASVEGDVLTVDVDAGFAILAMTFTRQ